MKFKSKSALAEHVQQLVKDGYLIPTWLTEISDDAFINQKTKHTRVFKINYKSIPSQPSNREVKKDG